MKNENEYQVFEELLRGYHDGDDGAAEAIVLRAEPMIKELCKDYFGVENEELMRDGRLRCFELIKKYKPEFVDVKFLGYLDRMLSCFFWGLQMRQEKLKGNRVLSTYDDILKNN